MTCIHVRDEEILKAECIDGKRLGFTGKYCIHPSQVDIIQNTFSPSKQQIEDAKEICKQWETNQSNGIGAFQFKGIVVDLPVYKRMFNILNNFNKS